MPDEIVTRTMRYFIGEDGILRAIPIPAVEYTLAVAEENLRAMASLVGSDRRCPLLTDGRNVKSSTREARMRYTAELPRIVSAMAVLVGSPASRVTGNIYLAVNKPSFPTRLFTSEEEALVWLKGFVDER